jgi:hypothetical protein
MAGITITTQNDLLGPDGDEPYVLFVNPDGVRQRPLPAHQCALGPARPEEIHRPALPPGGEAPPGTR